MVLRLFGSVEDSDDVNFERRESSNCPPIRRHLGAPIIEAPVRTREPTERLLCSIQLDSVAKSIAIGFCAAAAMSVAE